MTEDKLRRRKITIDIAFIFERSKLPGKEDAEKQFHKREMLVTIIVELAFTSVTLYSFVK